MFKSVDCNSNILKVNFSVIFVYLVFYASLNCVNWFIQHETIYVSLGPYRFHVVHLTIHSSVHKHFFWFDNKSFEKFIKTERPIEILAYLMMFFHCCKVKFHVRFSIHIINFTWYLAIWCKIERTWITAQHVYLRVY